MADDSGAPPIRLMNFVSEEQLDQSKRIRGERVEDGTAQRDKPLFEILKENKDKKDAEFNERFKHRPPKALDEDETEFLDNVEMGRKEHERQVANEEEEQLRSFQAAVAAQSSILHELKETTSVPKIEEAKPLGRKKPLAGTLGGLVIKVKPQPKKAKLENNAKSTVTSTTNTDLDTKSALGGLLSYGGDESDEDES